MQADYWPIFEIEVNTERLKLRPARDEDLFAMVEVAKEGLHNPNQIVFGDMWSNKSPEEMSKHLLQWNWKARGDWTAKRWTLSLAVFLDENVIGNACMFAQDFDPLRTFGTSSWIGSSHQGKGIGKEIRAAVLAFGFAGLSAVEARTNVLADNAPSIGVSKSLGYEENGKNMRLVGGKSVMGLTFKMPIETWENSLRDKYAVKIEGLDNCKQMFGAK